MGAPCGCWDIAMGFGKSPVTSSVRKFAHMAGLASSLRAVGTTRFSFNFQRGVTATLQMIKMFSFQSKVEVTNFV